ncbi:MAG: DUF2127 domain-containing protein [Verrucomicrobia bacterium]|nr:DUF2127 domain-containing protein [Verrucomicrobiota bacterium]
MSTKKNLRLIALLEAVKGVLVLLAGFGLLGLIHSDAQRMAEELVHHFHLNPASRFPRIFVEAATKSNDITLWLFACAAFTYAALRLVEAFGLWRQRRWAEWLAVVSGAVYIPIEIYELLHGVSWPKVTLLAVNTACVVYITHALRSNDNSRNT